MAFTAADVKKLREMTSVGMMDCKKALTEADGDFDKAIELLREKGLAKAAKKADRIAAEGLVKATVCDECGVGAIIEVNSETDFVAKNADFQQFVSDVANVVIKDAPADVEALKACKMGEGTVQDALQEKVLTIGENLQIRRFERFDNSTVNVAYNHMGGVIGVLVGLEVSDNLKDNATVKELGKDIGMQAAAMNPSFLDKSDVDEATLAKEKEILLIQALEENKTAAKPKPEQIIHKMVDGRIGKYYEENCLLQQAFVKENKVSVEAHIKAVAKELGGEIKLVKCVRFEKGEGIEKKVDDFAAEVASMAK
ncbi:MAG: translation elongation factor Ts [Agathobaculum butyriciproducens]|nr:translation elongation factor Ts [Agathobaculum butyriciproducens]